MTLPTQTEQQMIDGMTATFAASTGVQPVFTSGDALLAFFQTIAVQLDFLQALISQVVLLTRAQTSTGADLDAWMAQFGFPRLPPTSGDGPVTFTSSLPAVTPVNIQAAALVNGVYQGGVVIQTSNGGTQYQVIPNAGDAAYNATTNCYVLPIGQTSITATVQAVIAGAASNVSANTLIVIATPLPGITSVTNPAPIANGIDAESDVNFRARFILYLAALAQATQSAIIAAAHSVQQGLQISTTELQDPQGNPVVGAFTVYVDDGSGAPPTSTLNAVYAAVNAATAFGIQAFVAAPNITNVAIALTARIASGFNTATVKAAIQNAATLIVNALVKDQELYVSAVEAAALSVAGVVAVQPGTTLINGVNADLTPAANFELRTTASGVNVSTY